MCGGGDGLGSAKLGPHTPKEFADVTLRAAEGVGTHPERSRGVMLYLARLVGQHLAPADSFFWAKAKPGREGRGVAEPADIGADLGEDDLGGGCAHSWNVGEIDPGNAVKVATEIKLRIVPLAVIGRRLGAWWHRMLGRAGKSLHQARRLLIQLQDQLLVVEVSLQRLLQGEQMLRPVVSHQSLRHLVPRAQHPTMTKLTDHDEYLHPGGLGSEARHKQQGGGNGALRCEERADSAGLRERARNGSQLRLVATAANSFK